MKIFNVLAACCLLATSSASWAGYKLPTYEKVTLDNGLTLYLMEQNEVPLIDVNVVVKVGAIDDGTAAGLSYFTARNLSLGTKSLDKATFDETVDFVGADISTAANYEFSSVSASFAKKDSDEILPILRDVVLNPRFDETEFGKLKTRHLLNLTQSKESPRAVITNYYNRLLFGNAGYGVAPQGNQDSIEKLTLDQVKAHHAKWYAANNAAVIVVGDFDAANMKKRMEKLFGSWKASKAPLKQATLTKAKPAKKSNLVLVDKGDARESTFLIGGKGITRSNPDSVGISVINTILGGRFTSWLNDELRVNAGLTYGARSRFNSFSKDGTFSVYSYTKTSTTIETIDLALETYQRLWNKGIDEKTLASAKAYVKGQFPPKYETSGALANLLSNMYGYDFDEAYINTFEQQVDSLTVEKTKSLIKKYFPKENLQFVVVGNANDIRDQVKKYGDISEVNIKDVGFNIK